MPSLNVGARLRAAVVTSALTAGVLVSAAGVTTTEAHAATTSAPTAAQYHAVQHISRRALRPGDLVFASFGNGISHVGIYAGNGYMWHAPHTGSHVQRIKMYSAHWYYGRIIH